MGTTLFVFSAEAYDSLDPNGNITVKWDVMHWTPDGYVVSTILVSTVVVSLSFSSST
jgi:hypothetical protein